MSAMRRPAQMLAALFLIGGLVAGCGGGATDDVELRTDIRDLMIEDWAVSQEEADCFSEIMMNDVDHDVLRQAVDAGGDEAFTEEAYPALERGFDECFDIADLLEGVDLGDIDPGSIDLGELDLGDTDLGDTDLGDTDQ